MSLEELGRGNETDYIFGSPLGWDAFDTVRWHAVEGVDELFRYDIVLSRNAERGPVDVASLVDGGASFRIASQERWRVVHGLVVEACQLERTATQLLYRVVLAPHLVRACHRRRCRTFVERSLEEIIVTLVENRSAKHPAGHRGLLRLTGELAPPLAQPSFETFREPVARYRLALNDLERTQVPRRQVVQYNESDFDFLSRLLEAEGISYYFEHGDRELVMTLTDRAGRVPLFSHDETHQLVGHVEGGAQQQQEVIRSFHDSHRLRSATVTMRDYAWRKSLTQLQATAGERGEPADELEHFEFPAADEDQPRAPGRAPAQFQLERFRAEQALSEGVSTVRTLEPGQLFTLEDRANRIDPVQLLVVRVEAFAQQRSVAGTSLELQPFGFHAPHDSSRPFYDNQFATLKSDIPHRPTRRTPAPRISGVQTARVTAEEVTGDATELNSDELGRVRVRFPWDQRPNDGTPTSKWIRVAQYWAGPGFGALYVPRVGHEVLVAFERGNPDRPIIVGRLYNAQNPPPYAEANTTKSTIKSDSVGEDGSSADGFNELRFDDAASKEQVFLHAQRNLDEVVRANHSTGVGGDQSNSVGGNRRHTVQGTELVHVVGARTTELDATESHSVASHRVTAIGANDTLAVAADHNVNVSANQRNEVSGQRLVQVGGNQQVKVGAVEHYSVGADRSLKIGGNQSVQHGGQFSSSATEHHFRCDKLVVDAGGATLTMQAGSIVLDNGAGAVVALTGGIVFVKCGDVVSLAGTHTFDSGGAVQLKGGFIGVSSSGTMDLHSGGGTKINAGGNIDATGALIKLNG